MTSCMNNNLLKNDILSAQSFLNEDDKLQDQRWLERQLLSGVEKLDSWTEVRQIC